MISVLRPVIALAMASSVVIFTGSYQKAAWVSAVVFLLILSTTWKRYVELLCISAFAIAVVVACIEPDALEKAKLVLSR